MNKRQPIVFFHQPAGDGSRAKLKRLAVEVLKAMARSKAQAVESPQRDKAA